MRVILILATLTVLLTSCGPQGPRKSNPLQGVVLGQALTGARDLTADEVNIAIRICQLFNSKKMKFSSSDPVGAALRDFNFQFKVEGTGCNRQKFISQDVVFKTIVIDNGLRYSKVSALPENSAPIYMIDVPTDDTEKTVFPMRSLCLAINEQKVPNTWANQAQTHKSQFRFSSEPAGLQMIVINADKVKDQFIYSSHEMLTISTKTTPEHMTGLVLKWDKTDATVCSGGGASEHRIQTSSLL